MWHKVATRQDYVKQKDPFHPAPDAGKLYNNGRNKNVNPRAPVTIPSMQPPDHPHSMLSA